MERNIYPGMRMDDSVEKLLSEKYPSGNIIETRGRHYDLQESRKYLVRCGAEAVVMPQMKYSDEVEAALEALSEKENGRV